MELDFCVAEILMKRVCSSTANLGFRVCAPVWQNFRQKNMNIKK